MSGLSVKNGGGGGSLVVSDSLQPHGLLPARLLCPWNFPGKNTGAGCHFLLKGNLPDLGIEPASPALAGRFFTAQPPWQSTLFKHH